MALSAQAARSDGRDWWQEVPDSWDVAELRRVAEISASNVDKNRSASEVPVRLCNYTDVFYNDVIGPGLEFMEATATPREIEKFELRGGEVLLTKDSETVEDIAVPAYVRPGLENVVCGYHLYVVRPHPERLDGRFLQRACSVSPVRDQFVVAANGITRYGLGHESLGAARVPMPPLLVQSAIADFLDRKTAQIDHLIERKKRLIELLEQERTAFITRAVTKGLNPDVEMKDSGVEWLGEIPAHWDLVRTKHAARLETGHTPSRQHDEYWENCTIPWFGLADVWQLRDGRREYVSETSERISELGLRKSSARLLPAGTVILSRTASVGFSAILGVDMATTQDFVNWVCGPRLDPVYLLYVFRAMKPEFRRLTMGSTHQTIYMPDLHRFVTPLPPREEQKLIVGWLRPRLQAASALCDHVEHAIDLLREYRTALISAAVTGKIDVREEAA